MQKRKEGDKMSDILKVSHSPHIGCKDTVTSIMLDVIIALMPALIAGCFVFGLRALVVTMVCVLSCLISEYIWNKLLKKPDTGGDLSAVVTGMILAFNLPASIPYWVGIIGSVFAIIVVKQFFGGLGHNFMNPALCARAFLLASWPLLMTTWYPADTVLPIFGQIDAVTSATPLAAYASGNGNEYSYLTLLLGNYGGCIGETSSIAILIGAVYLIVKKVIRIRVPLIFILTVALGMWLFSGNEGIGSGDVIYQVLSGGLLLGACFMATDYTTSPTTPLGQIIFALGCGIITVLIRTWGGYPEGVTYAILLMNIATPLIDKITPPRHFGYVRKKKGAA